jgi:hypothetical protein
MPVPRSSWGRWLLVLLLAAAATCQASTVVIRNISPEPATLSDLVVFGAVPTDAGSTRQSFQFLVADHAADDRVLAADGTLTFYVGFDVVSYTASVLLPKGEDEAETTVIKFKIAPERLAWLIDPDTLEPLMLVIDALVAQGVPGLGEVIDDFVDGTSSRYPGLFVGRRFDFATGETSQPHTGRAQVFGSSFSIAVLATPSSLLLVLLACALLAGVRPHLRPHLRLTSAP